MSSIFYVINPIIFPLNILTRYATLTLIMAKPSPEIRAYMKRLSKKAAKARREKISPQRRSEIAAKAAAARWNPASQSSREAA